MTLGRDLATIYLGFSVVEMGSDTLSFLVEAAVTLTILDPLTGKTVTIMAPPPRSRETTPFRSRSRVQRVRAQPRL